MDDSSLRQGIEDLNQGFQTLSSNAAVRIKEMEAEISDLQFKQLSHLSLISQLKDANSVLEADIKVNNDKHRLLIEELSRQHHKDNAEMSVSHTSKIRDLKRFYDARISNLMSTLKSESERLAQDRDQAREDAETAILRLQQVQKELESLYVEYRFQSEKLLSIGQQLQHAQRQHIQSMELLHVYALVFNRLHSLVNRIVPSLFSPVAESPAIGDSPRSVLGLSVMARILREKKQLHF